MKKNLIISSGIVFIMLILSTLVCAGFDFVRQSIRLSEFRSLDNRMCGITPDKTDQNKLVPFCQVWSQRARHGRRLSRVPHAKESP